MMPPGKVDFSLATYVVLLILAIVQCVPELHYVKEAHINGQFLEFTNGSKRVGGNQY